MEHKEPNIKSVSVLQIGYSHWVIPGTSINDESFNAEKIVTDYYRKNGYRVVSGHKKTKRNGAPDFFITNGEESFFVEVKSKRDGIRNNQLNNACSLEYPIYFIYVFPEDCPNLKAYQSFYNQGYRKTKKYQERIRKYRRTPKAKKKARERMRKRYAKDPEQGKAQTKKALQKIYNDPKRHDAWKRKKREYYAKRLSDSAYLEKKRRSARLASRKYRALHPERAREINRKSQRRVYLLRHKDIREIANQKYNDRMKNDPVFAETERLRKKEYHSRPEVRERKKEYNKEYKQRPEAKAKRRASDKKRYYANLKKMQAKAREYQRKKRAELRAVVSC